MAATTRTSIGDALPLDRQATRACLHPCGTRVRSQRWCAPSSTPAVPSMSDIPTRACAFALGVPTTSAGARQQSRHSLRQRVQAAVGPLLIGCSVASGFRFTCKLTIFGENHLETSTSMKRTDSPSRKIVADIVKDVSGRPPRITRIGEGQSYAESRAIFCIARISGWLGLGAPPG